MNLALNPDRYESSLSIVSVLDNRTRGRRLERTFDFMASKIYLNLALIPDRYESSLRGRKAFLLLYQQQGAGK